jgi:hypothetical protein
MDGIACVALRNLQHIMVDLKRSTWDTCDSYDIKDETLPAEIYSLLEKPVASRHQSNQEKHATYNLLNDRKYHKIFEYLLFNKKIYHYNLLISYTNI